MLRKNKLKYDFFHWNQFVKYFNLTINSCQVAISAINAACRGRLSTCFIINQLKPFQKQIFSVKDFPLTVGNDFLCKAPSRYDRFHRPAELFLNTIAQAVKHGGGAEHRAGLHAVR